jgi:hypothetical protein
VSDPGVGSPPVAGTLRALLRAEGLSECLLLLFLYDLVGGSWWLFLALFLAPDLGFLGYLGGPRAGALAYNALHFLLFPALFGGVALAAGWSLGVSIALIWAAHVQFDRALGYGLKFSSGFADTHLGRIGRVR